MIFKRNDFKKETKDILNQIFKHLPEKFYYLRYGEINDFYLDLVRH